MPFLYTLLGMLVSGAGTLVGKVLISLGIGYFTYSGLDTLVSSVSSDALARIQTLSPVAVQLAGVLQVGTCINIMISALSARLLVMGLQSGTITKMFVK